jgi:hypothetical protein
VQRFFHVDQAIDFHHHLTQSNDSVDFDQLIRTQDDVDNIHMDVIKGLDVRGMVNLIFHTARMQCRLSTVQLEGLTLNLSRMTIDEFDAQSVSNVLYGLHPYNSTTVGVETLLMAILYKVSLCDEELRAQHISNSLYGLQGMDSKSAAVRKLVSVLAEV